jgi:ketosteroid isomerase-like protein
MLEVLAGVRDATVARDWDALRALYAVDCLLVDRRPAAWSRICGRAAMVEMYESFVALSPDVQQWFARLESDDEVAIIRWGWAGHAAAADGGGAFADAVTSIVVVRDRAVVYVEQHPDRAHTELAPLRARAEELRPLARRRPGIALSDEPLPVERCLMETLDALEQAAATGSWEAFRSRLAEDFTTVDRRQVPTLADATTRESFVAYEMSLAASATGLRRPYELLAASHTLTAAKTTVVGHLSDGDGPFELSTCFLNEWRDGVCLRIEFFDVDDEAGMLTRFAELEVGSGACVSHEVLATFRDAVNDQDWDALGACLAEDFLMVDRRLASWSEVRGRGEMVEHSRSFSALIPDVQSSFDPLDGDDDVAIVRWWWRGHAGDAEGGGPLEDVVMMILVVRNGSYGRWRAPGRASTCPKSRCRRRACRCRLWMSSRRHAR